MDENFASGPPRSTSRKMVLFVPRPWYRHCCRHNWHATLWHALLSWSYKMSAPLSTFNPHGGPITHRSQERNLTLLYNLLSKLFLVLDFVCNSRATCLLIYSGIGLNTYSRCSEPLSHFVSGIERLPARSKLPMKPLYFALDIFLSFNSRVTFRHLPRWYRPDSQPCRGPFFRNTPLTLS